MVDYIFAETLKSGGGTFSAQTHATFRPKHGYAVSISRGSATVCDLDEDEIIAAVERVKQAFPHARWIGTWVNEGRVVVDPVVVLWDRDDAYLLARALGQQAFYDFRLRISVEV